MLSKLHASAPDSWRIACLRYFIPVGAHSSGRIGAKPLGIPNNLFPFVSQVAVGRRAQLQVFGGDWPPPTAPACVTPSTCESRRRRTCRPELPAGGSTAAPHPQPGQRAGTLSPGGCGSHGSRQRPFHPLRDHRPSARQCRHQRGRSHRRRGRTAQLLNQTVIPTASTNSGMSAELIAGDLKSRMALVVKATHEPRV